MKASTREVRLEKTKGEESQRRSRTKAKGMKGEEVKRKKDGGSKKSGRRMGDLE